jgi:hypothetical protein
MAKTKVTPARPKTQAPADAIPLDGVTITCYPQFHFGSGEKQEPRRITGRQLGQVLAWLAQTRPAILGNAGDLWTSTEVGLKLEGLGEILLALGQTDLDNIPLNVPSVFCLLAEVASDLAARLQASEDGQDAIDHAMIALPKGTKAAA